MKPSCGLKVCNTTSVCLEKGCSKMCVQAPSFFDLHSASISGYLAKVKIILSQGRLDMNCKEWHRRTPVVVAAGEGHSDVVHLLVSNGADVSVVDDFGINILHAACMGGDAALVKYVLSLGKHDINGKVFCRATPVMLAAENGHRDVVELLVRQGANVLFQDNRGFSILHFACRGGNVDVVKYVLSQNMVDINGRGWKRMTPVMVAADSGHRKVVELLVRHGANVLLKEGSKNNILHIVCRRGHVEVVKYVLSLGRVDINSRGHNGMTPMFMAALRGHKDVVELLVKKGANVLLQYRKDNILLFACRRGHFEVVKYVLSLGMMDINSRGLKSMTPLMMAANNGHRKVVELLVRKGANVLLKEGSKSNILHFASRGGHTEVVKYILSLGMVDINSRDRKSMTPVMIAARTGHKDVVELLMRNGANVSLIDKRGNNLLHFACHGGHVEVAKYVLSQNMVNINSRTKIGLTPVMIAARMEHTKLVQLLEDNK